MRIAVDFDGTIVENQYPAIGVEKPFAVRTLKQLAAEGDEIILWTARSGQLLQDAVDWCESQGLKFFAVNSNYHTCVAHQNGFQGSRKIHADIFIDDRIIGGFPGWPMIYAKVTGIRKSIDKEFNKQKQVRKSGFLERILPKGLQNIRHRPNNIPAIYVNRNNTKSR